MYYLLICLLHDNLFKITSRKVLWQMLSHYDSVPNFKFTDLLLELFCFYSNQINIRLDCLSLSCGRNLSQWRRSVWNPAGFNHEAPWFYEAKDRTLQVFKHPSYLLQTYKYIYCKIILGMITSIVSCGPIFHRSGTIIFLRTVFIIISTIVILFWYHQ